jgi:hypothetical protein
LAPKLISISRILKDRRRDNKPDQSTRFDRNCSNYHHFTTNNPSSTEELLEVSSTTKTVPGWKHATPSGVFGPWHGDASELSVPSASVDASESHELGLGGAFLVDTFASA